MSRSRPVLERGQWAEPGRTLAAREQEAIASAQVPITCELCLALRGPFTWVIAALLWTLIGVAIWRGAGGVLLACVLAPVFVAGFWPERRP